MHISAVEKGIIRGLAISFCCSSIFAALKSRIGTATISAAGERDGRRSNGADRRNHHDRLHSFDCRQTRCNAAMDCVFTGLALMLWGFWGDDWEPLFERKEKQSRCRAGRSSPRSMLKSIDQPIGRAQQACVVARWPTNCTPIGRPPSPFSTGSDIAGSPVSVHSVQNTGSR